MRMVKPPLLYITRATPKEMSLLHYPADHLQTVTIRINSSAEEVCVERMQRETVLYLDWNSRDILVSYSHPIQNYIVPLKAPRHRDTAERIINRYKQCLEFPTLEDPFGNRVRCVHVTPNDTLNANRRIPNHDHRADLPRCDTTLPAKSNPGCSI